MEITLTGVNGSPRKGATAYVIEEALKAAEEIPGVKTQLINVRDLKISPCIHCNACRNVKGDPSCPVFKDDMEKIYPMWSASDAFLVASPVYHMTMTGSLSVFLHRLRPLRDFQEGRCAQQVAGGIAVGGMRNGGVETTLQTITNHFLSMGSVISSGGFFAYNGGSVWSNDQKAKGAEADTVGMETVRIVARKIATLAVLMKTGWENRPAGIEPWHMMGMATKDQLDAKFGAFVSRKPSEQH